MDSALKDFIDYVDKTLPLYGDTELLYLSFKLLIKDKNEAINSLEFYPHKNGYKSVRVIGIGKHKVSLPETAINEEKKELDGTKNGILYCESIDKDKPKKGYYYLLGSSSPFKPGKLDSIIDTANDRSSELELVPSRLKIRRNSMGGGKRRNSKRKSKKNKTYKRKSYKKRSYRKNPSRKNKKSKRISRKSRRSFIKKTRTNKSKGKRMLVGAAQRTRLQHLSL